MWNTLSDAASNPVATFIIAVLGLIGAIVALVWQFTVFKLSGSLVRVEARACYETSKGNLVHAPLASAARRHYLSKAEIAKAEQNPIVVVKARAVGRMPVSVTAINLRYSRISFGEFRSIAGPDFPCRIEPGEMKSWELSGTGVIYNEKLTAEMGHLVGILGWLYTAGGGKRTQAQVFLGDGKVFRSDEIRFLGDKEAKALKIPWREQKQNYTHSWWEDEEPSKGKGDTGEPETETTPTQP
jgi:hypothetical protein